MKAVTAWFRARGRWCVRRLATWNDLYGCGDTSKAGRILGSNPPEAPSSKSGILHTPTHKFSPREITTDLDLHDKKVQPEDLNSNQTEPMGRSGKIKQEITTRNQYDRFQAPPTVLARYALDASGVASMSAESRTDLHRDATPDVFNVKQTEDAKLPS